MKGRYQLTSVIWQEGGQYVSKCPELGVASCGSDPDGALAALQEAVELYLENAKALDILSDLEPALLATHRFTAPFEVPVP